MKVMIIGAGGFIGSYLAGKMQEKHIIIPVYKHHADLLDSKTVTNILTAVKPEVVINCLTVGGKDNINSDDTSIVSDNMTMFYNFYKNSNLFSKYINIGSGIELTESKTGYATSKKAISAIIKDDSKFINLRLWGCFGPNEPDIILLKRFMVSDGVFELENDRLFDYISIQDFGNIVSFVLNCIQHNNDLLSTYNCTYKDKYMLSDFLKYFCDINNIRKEIVVKSKGSENYINRNDDLSRFQYPSGLRLYGLAHGLKAYI